MKLETLIMAILLTLSLSILMPRESNYILGEQTIQL
jgi:hypothetical protein